jgi:hypothetical protein
MAATGTPWIDVHAHPGRCFLAGLDAGDPLVGMLGGPDVAAALSAARDAGLAAVTLSTVADLRVLGPDPVRGLRAVRPFEPGEAYADHRRQLAGIGQILAGLGVEVAVTPAVIESAWASGQIAVLLGCEGGDFLEDRLEALTEARALGASSLTLVPQLPARPGQLPGIRRAAWTAGRPRPQRHRRRQDPRWQRSRIAAHCHGTVRLTHGRGAAAPSLRASAARSGR